MAKEITKPTQKQIDYATRIAADLDISLPEKETSDAYSEFISVNKLKPTIKQKEYAAKIAGILNISLPEKETKTAYKEFVDVNKEAFSQRKIELANAVNILDYVRSQGLELKRDGRDYRVKNYSGGFIITPEKNSWNWFAENQGGGIVQLCMFLENKTYQEAVDTLVHDDMESIRRAPDWKPEPEQPKEFNLPEKNNTNRHVYAYLTKTRGIDEEIVKDMLDKDYIYENQQKSCVFVGRDNEGVPRHASVRSTNVSGKAYKKDVYGSQKKYSFSISGTSGTLNVFEAPIDLLSYMSLQKLQGKPINDSYLALGGVTDKALERFLEDYKDIKVLRICTDGDDAGKNAASKMDEKFGKDLKVIRQVPEHKDFNEDLIELRQILAEDVKKNSVTAYEEQIKKQNKIVDEKSAETSKQSKQLTEQIKNGDYKNLNERMQDLLDSMEDLTNSVADRTKMRLEEMNRKEWERLLGNAQWIQLERPKELPTEYFEDSKIEKVELLYELEEMHEQEIKSFLEEQINSPDKFYLGYVNGRKELIFRAPFFDSEEYYVSGQATEDYMRGHKSLKELAADIYDQPDLISLAVDEGHLNHEEREKSFAQQVDESLRGDMPFYSSLKVCDTPELLLQVGCEQLPMLYTQKHLRNAVKPVDEQKHRHGLSVDQIKALPQLLESPVMVLDSVSRKDSIVVVTSEFDKEDNPVVVSVKPNGKGRYEIEEINANFITSVYSKNKFVKFFERNIEADSVLYISKEKSQTLFERWGLQLPELTNNLDFDRIIHLSNNIVNSKNIILEENDHPMMGVNITTDINEDFTREDFTGVKFQGNKITEAVFTECNFTDALIESEITDTQFIRCNFKNAQIQNTTMEYSDLRENNFEGTNFQGVSIEESSLCRNDFLNTKMGAVYLSNNFVEDNINGNTIQFITEGLFKEEAEIIRRKCMEELNIQRVPIAIESTIDYEDPEIGFTRFATENMPAGTKYRLVTYGEDGKLIPYQKASVIYNDRAKVQEYIEEHKNELEIVSYDDMVYQAGNRNAEYIRKQNQLIEEGLHNFSFDEEGYLHFSININDSSYEGLYRVYNPEKGRSRMLVSIENGEKEPFFEKNWELIRRNLELYVNEHPMIGAEGEIIPREKVSVYCEWSEHDAFEEDRVYSVSEFDRLMKQADTQWRELRNKEREQYGDADTAFESLREQGLLQHQGYAKVKYTVYVPGMEPLTLRQDVGDGFGSMIDYIKRTRHKHYGDILDKQIIQYEDTINDIDQTFILTNAKVSLEMQDILKRLEKGEKVSIHEINATKEIQYCRSVADNGKETYLLDGREDKQKQVLQYMESIGSASGHFDENGKMIYDGDIRQDRRLDIVIGFIGAGKSSALTDVISQEFHSKVIDNDMAKAQFVEYQDGLGARLVHEEAQMICDKAFAESLKRGENIVMPKVGSNVNKLLQNTIAKAKVMYGYEVNVHFMDLDREKALGRVLSRLISDGRFLDPELIYKYCPDKEHNYCERSYEALKQNGLVSGYSRWDNDVAKGEKPFMVESYNLTGEYIANARVKENQEGVVEHEGIGLRNDGDSRQGIRKDDGEYGRVGESSGGGLHENGKEDLSGGSRSLEEGRETVDDDLEKTEIIGEIKDDIPQALRKLQDEDRINTEVIETLEAMEKTEEVLQALDEAYEERKSITKRVIELTWDKDDQEPLADAVLQEASTQEFSAKSYADFAASHQQALKETEVSRIPVVINAFGGPGSGKSVSCMDICQQLKKLGYNAEYVQEYAKELVYDKDWEMLDGSPDNQFEVLKEQLRRVDRLYGKADFIVTDSPILLNGVYNKSLTPEYDAMVTSLYNDFENFTYFVERDASAYQQEGRIQNLEESQKIDQDIKQLLSEKEIYYGTYNHNTIDKIVSNAIRTFNRINQTGEEATKKQIAYAEKIAKTLNIDLPEEKTKAAYKAFISENQEKFAIINAPLREEKTSAGNYQDYLQMVAENGSTFKDVPKEHYTDELFLAAVSNWGNAIRLIPEERITAEIAMASVQQFGLNLKYVPERLKSEDICVAAYVSSSGKSVRYTPNVMKEQVKELGQARLTEDDKATPNTKRQLEEEKLQEQGQEWITQIDNMLKEHESDPEAMIEDIAFASKFYKYSAKNIQLMRRQNKGITYVASASAFEKMGYHIKDNEPAMIGRVPVFARYVTNEQDERIYSWNYTPEIKQKIKEGTFTEEQTVRKFKFAAAFYDISQTDCPADDYPSIFHMGVPSEFHQEAFNAMKEFAEKTLGFRVMVTDLKSISLRGSCEPDNKIIRINERLESTMMLSTLCHEIAHGIIHTSKNSGKMSTAQKECEADVMDIMLESSLGLSINESRREHLFQSFHAYKEEQAAKERPYEVTLEKLIDRVQTKVFRPYAEDMNYYLDIHLPAEGSQNEIIAESVIKNIALLDSVSGTDHREEIGKQKEIFDAGRMEEYQELYQCTKEEYRLNNSFVPKLAILKSMDGETFYVQDIRLLDEKTAAMIKEHPEEITMEHLPYNIEAGNILALKESVLADSRIYVVNKEEQLADVTESLQAAFKIQETRINCSFDVKTEYQCLHNLLENGFGLEQEYIKRYEYLCSAFDFSKNLETDSGIRLMAQINLVTEGLSQNNRELIAEYVFRTGNFAKAQDYAKQIENEPYITRKLLLEMKLVDSYKYMLWTIEQYENSNDISEKNRITTGAYNSSAIPVLSENVNSLAQINNSFLFIRKYASPESVKYYAIVEEDEIFRIAYVELNEYQPETVYSTVSFGSHGEAEEFYDLYLKTPKTKLADGNQAENLVEMENKENQIALSDITSIGKTIASEKQQYKEMGIDEEGALELLRTEIRDEYPDIKGVKVTETDNDLQILKDFKRMVAYYGEEHFIELCNLNDFTDKAAVEESFQLSRWLTEQEEIFAGMDYTGSEDVKQCVEAALESSVTGTDIEQAFNAIDSAVLSAEFSNLETEFEGFEEYNNVLDTLKAAQVTPDKFCYIDFDAAPGPYLYTSDRAGNIYRKPLRDEWDGSVRDLNIRLKEGGYEICSSLDDFKAYSANNRLGIFDSSSKEKNEAYVRILESTNDMLPKNHILSVYDFKNTVDKLYSGSREFNDDITYKLVTRKDKEIHSYIDTYSRNREQNVYEQLYAKAQEKEPVPELSRVISRQYYQDQVSFNENHQIRPLLEQLKKQDKPIEDSEELNALMGTNDKLKEEIRKLDLSPADAELLKLTAGSIQTEQIANMERQMQMNQQTQQQRAVRRQQQEMAI